MQRRLSGSQNARLAWETVLIQLTAPLAGTDESSLLARIEALEAEVSALKALKASLPAQSPVTPTKVISNVVSPKASTTSSAPVVEVASPKIVVGTKQTDDLGWGMTTSANAPSVSPVAKSTPVEPQSTPVAKTSSSSSKTEAKNKQGSAGQFWQKLLSYLEEKKPSVFALVRGTKCLSARQGLIVIKFESDRQADYEAASQERTAIEEILTEVMQRPIKIDLRLGKVAVANPQDEYMHTVNLVLNSFAGQTLSKYANGSASDPATRVEA